MRLNKTLLISNHRTTIEIRLQNSPAIFEMAFDRVLYQDGNGHEANDLQIEIELKSAYVHRVNLKRITDALEEEISGLESSTESKYIRGRKLLTKK